MYMTATELGTGSNSNMKEVVRCYNLYNPLNWLVNQMISD